VLAIHLLGDLGDRLAVNEIAEDPLDNSSLLGNDDELEAVCAEAALLVVLGLAIRDAGVPVATAAHAEASKHLAHLALP
jgi:hypothetical protein